MRRIFAFTSDRSDETPMRPVVAALQARGVDISIIHTPDPVSLMATGELDPPDIALLLGDRWEIGHIAVWLTKSRIPIAHIHGGEETAGSFDNQTRHAITKMAHIHFVATQLSADRVRAMGEGWKRVYLVGAPGLDNIPVLARKPERLKMFVVTYHPPTLGEIGIDALLEALSRFRAYFAVFSTVNNDPGADVIEKAIDEYISAAPLTAEVRVRLLSGDYHDHCRRAAAVVGNSSSGIIEAPALEVPSVNIGRRQEGRERGPSVIDAREGDVGDIVRALTEATAYRGPFTNPYGERGASAKIAEVLATVDLNGILEKRWSS